MPKVNLGEQNKREEALRAYINEKKGEGRLYRTGGDFAENAMGVTPESFSKWKKRGFPAFFSNALPNVSKDAHHRPPAVSDFWRGVQREDER